MKKRLISLLVMSAISGSYSASGQSLFLAEQLLDKNGSPISDWVENNQAITITLIDSDQSNNLTKSPLIKNSVMNISHNNEEFQIILGDSDISSLFSYQNNQLIYHGGIPLPAGENELLVSQLVNGNWQSIGQFPLSIMTSTGFKQAEWTPRLDLNINSQLAEKVSGDATESERPTYSDVTASFGLSGLHQNDDLSIETNINLLSVSNRQQAIQYGTQLEQASKLDVSDYSVAVQKGNHRIIVGHTSYGSNPLLIDNLSRRGVSWQYQNEDELTFNGAILSGSDIVGYNNFFGLSDYSTQYVNSLGFGVNTFTDSRISLRVEGTYLDAQRQSQNDFGIGEIASAEKNTGVAFRFVASDAEGRFNADLSVGLSRYTNPEDLELSLGDELVRLDTETSMAYNLNASYALVQEWQTPWDSSGNITLNGNISSADPLYQTLTAYVQANIKNAMLGAQYQFGNVSGNISTQSSQDNLDNLVNLLTTKSTNDAFSISMPLAQMFADETEQPDQVEWQVSMLPSLDYNFQQLHQYAVSTPDPLQSGLNGGSHLPDQMTTSHSVAGSWQFDSYSLSIQSNYSDQDNRQIGRELSDFTNLQHAASINIQQNDSTSWSFSVSKNRLADIELAKVQYSKSATISFNWQSIDGLAFSANYGITKDDDSLNEASSDSTIADIGLIKNLIQGEWFLPLNGSINLRLNYNDSQAIDNVFQQANRFGTKTAQLGINLSF